MSKCGVNFGPYFPVFGQNTEIYFVNLLMQPEYRKIRTRKNSVFVHISRRDFLRKFEDQQTANNRRSPEMFYDMIALKNFARSKERHLRLRLFIDL